MHLKNDKKLETKEGRTMLLLVKNLPSHYHLKKPLAMLMYLLVYQKPGTDQTNKGKLTKTSYTIELQEVGRGIKVVRRLL